MLFIITNLHEIEIGNLTACVTRAGAGGGTPSDWENAEARKRLGIAPESPASGARFVSPFFFSRKKLDMKGCK